MEALKSIGMSLCITAVATSIFSMLIPNSNLEKVIKFAVSLFFITGIVSPFINGNLKVDFNFDDITPPSSQTQFSQGVNTQFLTIAQNNLQISITKILEKESIKTKKITVKINISEQKSISINKITVFVDEKYKNEAYRIENIVKKEVGVTPLIEYI
ncbi:MAG: stage III sporulation protein AF [Oscillospiraceae bacterium]